MSVSLQRTVPTDYTIRVGSPPLITTPQAYIGVAADAHPRLDTINSSAASSYRSAPRRHVDEVSVTSQGSKTRMSVAQRARLEANTSSGTIRVRTKSPSPPVPTLRQRSPNSQGSFLTSMAKSLSDAIDNSVLGVGADEAVGEPTTSSEEEEEEEEEESIHNNHETENEHPPIPESGSTLSLQERQQLQRAKQIAFLKEQGLIKAGDGLRGGAGAPSPTSKTQATPFMR
eukprot:CAMPEP_0116845078 /NCGR_PEP_ID=MMETSP0418-20121206/13061_1 /TAXON_ID=1158023 /ORGANISM="Astrosyne radiata, Strain 13vi08-1A" /LENGTH=228 /DNA_ID=CAMNT_0004476137 /DNA_START=30 /DNA_END=716 /DNA_ORIENTATION=-